MKALLLLGLLVGANRAAAFDYQGRVNAGAFQAKETATEPTDGQVGNDKRAAVFSFYFNASRMGPFKNEFALDIRDRYDFFGAKEVDRPYLVASNEPEVRQVALKSKQDGRGLKWKLGRFPVADIAVIGNDGADLGARLTPRFNLGVFGGLHPERFGGRTLKISEEDQQAGAYGLYDDRSPGWRNHTQVSGAIVSRQPVAKKEADEADVEDNPNLTPVVDPVDPYAPTLFLYTQTIYEPGPWTRIHYLSQVDVTPSARIRNLWVSWFQRGSPRVQTTVSLFRLDLTEYERQRDVRDELGPSAFTRAAVEARYKVSKSGSLAGSLSQGVRSLDSLSRTEFGAKYLMTGLLRGRLAGDIGGGYRKNYKSKDTLAHLGIIVYGRRLDLGFTQQYIAENHDDGEALHPLISDLSVGYAVTNKLYAHGSLEYAKDENVAIASGIVGIGARFSSGQLTPRRGRTPDMEHTPW